ncbi:MAG: DUF305 domain-containing protein [Humibacillus sp.]|nr:DUF305 domain-containing protein [Humibacillus sp.]MDN5777939.1 DUF305 domain-containing protein [Humibacillus sp.]
MNRTIRHAAITTASALTALALTACGSTSTPASTADQNRPASAGMTTSASSTPNGNPSPDAASGQHNVADITFAAGMVPHHQQAVTMSQMARKQAASPQVKALAADIQAAQGPEIQTMTGWLTAWGQPAPTSGGHDMSQMGGTGMGGMMTDEQMQQLSAASGAAFDRMWLQMMVAHHQGAVEMSGTELSDGKNADAKKLAQQIIDAQKQEITVMKQLLPTIKG